MEVFFLGSHWEVLVKLATNLLLSSVKPQRKVALEVASSGIAATLLPEGRTAHSTFKLPLDLNYNETPICNIKRGTNLVKLLEETSFIV